MERISLQKRDRLHQGNGLPESPRNGPRSENRPARRFRIALIALAVLFLPLLSPSPIPAREDSARLRLKMTAGDTKTRIHIVKKGEWIHDILRNEYGGEPVPYALVRRLNPRIPNLNRIYPGQRIRLPVRGKAGSSPPATELRTGSVSPAATYRIRNGDSISRILLGEMEIPPEEALATYRLIREMNPAVDNMAELPAGQLLKLPPGLSRPSPPAPEPLRPPARIAEKAPDPLPAVAPSSGEVSLGIIPAVIGRMKGSVTAKGNYFIPLAENSQVTIDCSLIPVVEMDDGTTVLLDFGNRLSEPLKGLIRTSWPNYAFLGAEELREDLSALQRIVNQSKGYRMARSESPMVLFSRPEVQVSPDWIITGAGTRRDAPYRQGIFLLREGETPFRPEIRAFLDKSGFVATEISKNQALAPPVSPSATETVTDLSGFKGIAFAVELLALLEMQAVRGAEIAVFEQARDGFSLSVTADLLLRRGGKQFVFRTKRLPDQFVRILNDAGTEVILLGEKDRGRSLIEGVLRGLGIPVSSGYFSFRIPEDSGRPRISATLPALRTESGGKTLYLIDFELPPDAISLLRDRRGGRVVRY